MATAVQNALKRKKELERELAEIDRFLAMHDRFSQFHTDDQYAGTPIPLRIAAGEGDAAATSTAAAEGKIRGRPTHFADVMMEILKESNRPMQRADLVAAMEKRGITIPSEDKERYLGTILWRFRTQFTNVPGQGYMLADDVAESAAAFQRIKDASEGR